MTELQIILMLPLGLLLWMLGGKYWKGFRRFVWPVLAAGILLWSGLSLLTSALILLALLAVNSLPYGDRTPWAVRVLVFGALALPVLVITLKAWWALLVMGVLLSLLFLASRKINWVTFKVWEGAAGFLQAVVLVLGRMQM